jgi:hypothetical protein
MRVRKALFVVFIVAGLTACDRPEDGARYISKADDPINIVEISAAGMRFEGGGSISSGWTTIRLNNQDNMLHFAMVVRLPDGVTANVYSDDLGAKFQRAYDLMLEGKDEEVTAVFGSMPDWVSRLTYHGGPGFISGNGSAEATQYLEPGDYILECYIKSNGIFHSYSPDPGKLAMLLPLKVTDIPGNMAEPEANATLTISESGIQLTEGDLKTGKNSIRVKFDTQIRYPSFVGQDVHIMRINTDADIQSALNWMDWQKPEGLLVPSPVTFIGGINDVMPAGSTAYFSADLSPGRYAFISETPEADRKGLLMEFKIPLDN